MLGDEVGFVVGALVAVGDVDADGVWDGAFGVADALWDAEGIVLVAIDGVVVTTEASWPFGKKTIAAMIAATAKTASAAIYHRRLDKVVPLCGAGALRSSE